MNFTLAPMEGLTGTVFRRCHFRRFGGADLYYTPFVTPTREPRFTDRQMKELSPEANAGMPVIPQLLTRRPEDFVWAAKAIAELGYPEVNLNLGCPMGTVTAKGKGSGMLRDPIGLESFFEAVFREPLPIPVSVKTRLGWSTEEEFGDLVRIFNRFPFSEVIVHARVRCDFYRGDSRREAFEKWRPEIKAAAGYNGDVFDAAGAREAASAFPGLRSLMIGRAAVANPALFRQIKGGAPCSRKELFAFHRELLDAYTEAFGSVNNTVGHMKQYWFYMKNLFEGGDRIFKKLLKARRCPDYLAVVSEIEETVPMREDALPGWRKPANDPSGEA